MTNSTDEHTLGRDFRTFWLGQSTSIFGNEITRFAWVATLLVALNAGSTTVAGVSVIIELSSLIVPILMAPLIASHNPFSAAAVLDFARAILVAGIAALWFGGVHDVAILSFVVVLVYTLGAVYEPLYFAAPIHLVGRHQLPTANSRLSLAYSASEVSGPALASAIFSAAGPAWCFVADGVTFVASGAALRRLRRVPVPEEAIRERPDGPRAVLRTVRSGLRHLWGLRPLRLLTLFAGSFNLIGGLMVTALPIIALTQFRLSVTAFGLLQAAGGLFGVLAGLLGGRSIGWLGHHRTLVLSTALPVAPMVWVYLCAGSSSTQQIVALGCMEAAAAFAATMYIIANGSLRQQLVAKRDVIQTHVTYKLLTRLGVPAGAGAATVVVAATKPAACLALAAAMLTLLTGAMASAGLAANPNPDS